MTGPSNGAFAIAVAFVALSQGRPINPQNLFHSDATVVTVDVSVRTRTHVVTGLTAADFELRDTGVPQSVDAVSADGTPVDVTLVFDVSDSTAAVIGGRFNANVAGILNMLRPDDGLQLVTFATDVRSVSALKLASEWRAAPSELNIERRPYNSLMPRSPTTRAWALFDALLVALFRPAAPARRALTVVFCSCVDATSAVTDGEALRDVAERTDSMLYVVMWDQRRGPTGWKILGLRESYTRQTLAAAALSTGGDVENAANGVAGFKTVFDRFRESYLLRYRPAGVTHAGWHPITVRLPGFPTHAVQARRGYWAVP